MHAFCDVAAVKLVLPLKLTHYRGREGPACFASISSRGRLSNGPGEARSNVDFPAASGLRHPQVDGLARATARSHSAILVDARSSDIRMRRGAWTAARTTTVTIKR